MLKGNIQVPHAIVVCLFFTFFIVNEGDTKRFKPPERFFGSSYGDVRRPGENGEFEIFFNSPDGKRIGCSGFFSGEGKEEVANIYVEDKRGRKRVNTASLSSKLRLSVFPSFSEMLSEIKTYAFLPVICLFPVLRPLAGLVGIDLGVDMLNVDNMLSFNVNSTTSTEVELEASFACPRGAAGPPGRMGAPGAAGYPGPIGPGGLDGSHGKDGEKGPPGDQGSAGSVGLPGPTGPRGEKGLPGPQGEPGEIGSDGRGGILGAAGSSGAAGAPGSNAFNGSDGRDGKKGPVGLPGLPGKIGLSGKIGLPASSGSNGISGTSGLNGEHGISGVTGIDGENAICPGVSKYTIPSSVSSSPSSNGCSFVELSKKDLLLKGSVTIGGGGGGGGGSYGSGPGGSGGTTQGVGISDVDSTGLGFYICNSKNLTFVISIDNNSDRIAINDSKSQEEDGENETPEYVDFDFLKRDSGKVKVQIDADGSIDILPLGNTKNHWSFKRHFGVHPRNGLPVF